MREWSNSNYFDRVHLAEHVPPRPCQLRFKVHGRGVVISDSLVQHPTTCEPLHQSKGVQNIDIETEMLRWAVVS